MPATATGGRRDRAVDAGVELRRADGPPITAALVSAGGWPAAAWMTSVALTVAALAGLFLHWREKRKARRMIYVDIVSDTICPWCYIGKRRFERALDLSGRNDIALSVAAVPAQSRHAAEGMTRDDYVRAEVRRRRPAAPDLPGDRRERPRGRHRIPVRPDQAHAQHRCCRTG
jgi:hypothetical protein